MFEVEKIVGKQKFGRVWKYKVKWMDFPENKCTWEPEENLESVRPLLKAYEDSMKKRPKSRRKVTEDPEQESQEEEEESKDSSRLIGKKRKNPVKDSDSESKEINKKNQSEDESEEENPKSRFTRKKRRINVRSETPPRKEPKSNAKLIKSPVVNFAKPAEPREGDLSKDTPKRIITAKQHLNRDDLILCEVEWLPANGVQLINSSYTNAELKKTYPMILCEFYERCLVYPMNRKK